MRIAVSNSSPLILLTKVNALEILFYFFDIIYIPPTVYQEVVENGIQNKFIDAIQIKEQIDRQKIKVKTQFSHALQVNQHYLNNIHQGEIETIELALSIPNEVILLDDEEARKIARFYKLKVKGTLGLLIEYRKEQKIDKKKALELLKKLNKLMYLSADLYEFVENNL